MKQYGILVLTVLMCALVGTACGEPVYRGEEIEEKIREEYGIPETAELLDGGLIARGDDCVIWKYTEEPGGEFVYYPTGFEIAGRAEYTFTETLGPFRTDAEIAALETGGLRQIFMNDADCVCVEMIYADGRVYREEIRGIPVLYSESADGGMHHVFRDADGNLLTYPVLAVLP